MKIHVRNNYGKFWFHIENWSILIFSEVMIKQFFDFYDYYVDVCTDNSNKDGQQMIVNNRIPQKAFY